MAALKHKTISQGRKTIVFGLSWYTVEDDESPRKAGAALAKEIQGPYDLLVARKEEAAQFGLASSLEGAKPGAYSAAAIVADLVTVDSWIYVLEIEASIWICSGREGYILPAGDQVYENQDEARRAFHALSPSSFKKVYLPSSWKNSDTEKGDLSQVAHDIEETDILDFIEYSPPKWAKMSAISPVATLLKTGSLVALLGTAAAVAFMVLSGQGHEPDGYAPTPEQIRQARERILQQEKEKRLSRYAQLDAMRPWHDLPRASSIMENCLDAIRDMPSHPVGYEVRTIYCDGNTVDAAVERTTGYSTWLEEWAETHPGIEASTSSNGDNGFLTRKLSNPGPRGPQELRKFDDISREMLRYGQIEGASVDVTTPAAAVIESEPDYVPYYAASSFRISTKHPEIWTDLFRATPGLGLKTITYAIDEQLYTMEGEIYVPNL